MACVKLVSNMDSFRREGQAWFCTSSFPSDVTVEVGDMSFHLHQFTLMSRSGVMDKLIREASMEGEECCIIQLPQIPGDAKTFEIIAKFCYGYKLELTAFNVVHLRCAAELLQMTEDFGEGNLVMQTEDFLNQVVLTSWRDSILALQTCKDVLPLADDLHIVKRCIESIAAKACADPKLFVAPVTEDGLMPSPGSSLLCSGVAASVRPTNFIPEWWYDDVSCLSLPIYKRLISTLGYRGIGEEIIATSLVSYAKRHLPGLKRFRASHELGNHLISTPSAAVTSEQEQKLMLEEICGLLPMQKGIVPTKLLFGLLRIAMILQANPSCVSSLERTIGLQLDEASLEDLLMPNYSHSMEMLYNVDSVRRILVHFLSIVEDTGGSSPYSAEGEQLFTSPSLQPLTAVVRLMDNFLAEIAPDLNLKAPKFQTLVALVPDYARPLADGLYHAIDTYLKAHPWLDDSEREQLCRYIDCQKLSVQACTHAAQNERLPMRVIVQVLFFEQLQLKSSVASCFLVSDNLDVSRACRRENAGIAACNREWKTPESNSSQEMRVGMEKMRARVNDLEKECSHMRQAIEKMGKARNQRSIMSSRFGLVRMQMCSVGEGAVVDRRSLSRKAQKLKTRAIEEGSSFHLET